MVSLDFGTNAIATSDWILSSDWIRHQVIVTNLSIIRRRPWTQPFGRDSLLFYTLWLARYLTARADLRTGAACSWIALSARRKNHAPDSIASCHDEKQKDGGQAWCSLFPSWHPELQPPIPSAPPAGAGLASALPRLAKERHFSHLWHLRHKAGCDSARETSKKAQTITSKSYMPAVSGQEKSIMSQRWFSCLFSVWDSYNCFTVTVQELAYWHNVYECKSFCKLYIVSALSGVDHIKSDNSKEQANAKVFTADTMASSKPQCKICCLTFRCWCLHVYKFLR